MGEPAICIAPNCCAICCAATLICGDPCIAPTDAICPAIIGITGGGMRAAI